MDDTRCTQSIHCSAEQKLYNELKPAIWAIVDMHVAGISLGTGFCIDPKGLIMTCSHCVKGETVSVSTQDDKEFRQAVLLHRNEQWDVAVFCLEEELNQPSAYRYPQVSLVKDGALVPGQDVYSIGHQNRFMYSFSSGKVSYPCSNTINNFGMPSNTSKTPRLLLSTTSEYRTAREVCAADIINLSGDLPIIEIMNLHSNYGGSGSPVLLPCGEVVGMVMLKGESKSHALHVSALKIALKQANEEYNKRVSSLRAKLDEKDEVKNVEEVTEADKSRKI